MSDNISKAVANFQNRFALWESREVVEHYLTGRYQKTLAAEFKSEPASTTNVCVAFKEIDELQLRSQIAETAEGLVGSLLNFP